MKLFLLVFLLVASAMAQVPAVPTPPVYFSGSVGPGGKFPFFNNGSITMADADYTMVVPDFTASVIVVQGTLTNSHTLYAPATHFGFEYTIINATAGNFAIVVKPEGNAAATGVTIPNGQAMMVIYNGVDYVSVGSPASVGPGGGLTSINGSTAAAHTIAGNTGVGVSTTTAGATTVKGQVLDAIYDCHLVGDGVTDDSAALQACLDANPGRTILMRPTKPGCPGGSCRQPASYYMGSTTIHLRKAFGTTLSGEGSGKYFGGTGVYWAPDTTGISIDSDCAGCTIKNIYLSGPDNLGHPAGTPYASYDQCALGTSETSGTFGSWSGIFATGSNPIITDVMVTCFNGNGISIRSLGACGPTTAAQTGVPVCAQPDLWRIDSTQTDGNRGHGILIEGSDSNVGTTIATNNFGNELWGILDHNSFGDTHISPHTNSNGREAIARAGVNTKQAYWMQRTNNVVTACFIGAAGSVAPGFATGNLISLFYAADPSFNSGSAPITVTGTSGTAAGVACPIVTGQVNGFGGWITFNQTGPNTALISVGPDVGIVSNISSIARNTNTVTLTAAATSTTITPNDIKVGTWIKIIGTGNAAFDNHVFRAATAVAGAGNAITVTFPYLGANIPAISTGYVYSASSGDIMDPVENIRTVMDGYMTAGSTYLYSETAQFSSNQQPPFTSTLPNPYVCGLANNVGCGAPVVVRGAGPGGADLVSYIVGVDYSTRVHLHDAASTAVSNAQVDMGGAWKGGAYWSYTATWINPYLEYNQTTFPLSFGPDTVSIGGNINTYPNRGGSFSPNLGFNDPWIGSPTSINGSSFTGINQLFQFTDSPATWYFRSGLTRNVNSALVLSPWDNTAASAGGTSHTVAFSTATPGGFEMADNQFSFSNNNLEIRLLNPASTAPTNFIRFNNGQSADFIVLGHCTTSNASGGGLHLSAISSNVALTAPCIPTAAATASDAPQLTLNGYYWNGTAAASQTWAEQVLFPTSITGPLTKSTFRIAPIASGGAPLNTLSTDTLQLDSVPFSTLAAYVTDGVTVGTQVYCTNCTVATPASCSLSTPAACVCAQGTGGTIASYENFANGGTNWYCAKPGASSTGGAGGNVSTSGSPAQYQVGVWTSPTTISGIASGTAGQVLTSNGAGANPSWQAGGSASPLGPTFPVTTISTTSTIATTTTDWDNCQTLAVSAGSPTIQLPATTPANGKCIWVINYGTGAPAITRLGTQTINGSASNISVQGGNNLYPVGYKIVSDGTNFVVQRIPNGTFSNMISGTMGGFQVLTVGTNGSLIAPSTNTGNVGTINGTRFNATTNTLQVIGNVQGTAPTTTANVAASGNITSDTGMYAPSYFTCTTANPCTTASAATAPVGRATGGEPLSTRHLADFSTTAPTDGQVPIYNVSQNRYVPGTITPGGGGSTAWSSITAPTASLSLTMGAQPSTLFFNSGNGANLPMWWMQDSGAGATTANPFFKLQTNVNNTLENPFMVTSGASNGLIVSGGTGNITASGTAKFVGPVQLTGVAAGPLAADATGNIIAGSSGGGTVPAAGIANSTGTAWGTSYSATNQIPANFVNPVKGFHTAFGAGMVVDKPPSWITGAAAPTMPTVVNIGQNITGNLTNQYNSTLSLQTSFTNNTTTNSANLYDFNGTPQIGAGSVGFSQLTGVYEGVTDFSTGSNQNNLYGGNIGAGTPNITNKAGVGEIGGLWVSASPLHTGSTINAFGLKAGVHRGEATLPTQPGTLPNAYNIWSDGPVQGSITNLFGFYASERFVGGTTTNYYAHYVKAPTINGGVLTNKYTFVSEPGSGPVGVNTIIPTHDLEVNGTTQTSNLIVTGTCTGCGGSGGGGGGPIYSTPLFNQTVGTTGTVALSTTTMVTPTSNTTYRVEVDLKQTNTPACTTFPSVAVRVSYTDADTGVAIPGNQGGLVLFTSNGNNATASYATFTSAAPGQGNSWYSVPMTFYAQSGQPVSLVVWQQAAGASCTTLPTYTVRPYLYQVQ